MKNIAVMISGHPKFFNLTYKFFQYWNKLYDNVKFDFYVSMWENDYDKDLQLSWFIPRAPLPASSKLPVLLANPNTL